jgi:hypothetical protein
MSRTDKDMPYWVITEWYEPYHWRCSNSRSGWEGIIWEYECTLPPLPVREGCTGIHKYCRWVPVWPYRHWYGPQSGAPRWYRQQVWYAPDRRKTRNTCLEARKEYRATGESDTEPPTNAHRHCASWSWH